MDVKPHATEYLLFGFGDRRKLVFVADGRLADARTGDVVERWPDVQNVHFIPDHHAAYFQTADGNSWKITEREWGVYVGESRTEVAYGDGYPVMTTRQVTAFRTDLRQSDSPRVSLPEFAPTLLTPGRRHRFAPVLRVLLGEILFNIVDGAPLPNLYVYDRPWYRDAAMVAMVLEKTGNLHLIRDWILGLREPYDRNNGGNEEPDNLGQALYLISLVADASHPLVPVVLEEARRRMMSRHLTGTVDFAEHPVYATKWLRFGLRCLGLPDDEWTIPRVPDSYSALVWWDFTDEHVDDGRRFSERDRALYPYLGWAEDHFYGVPPRADDLLDLDGPLYVGPYPLTWEAEASQADYAGMARVRPADAESRVCRPHTWHAAEMFLYLWEYDPEFHEASA